MDVFFFLQNGLVRIQMRGMVGIVPKMMFAVLLILFSKMLEKIDEPFFPALLWMLFDGI